MDITWYNCYQTRDTKVKRLVWLIDGAADGEMTLACKLLAREDFVVVDSTKGYMPRILPPVPPRATHSGEEHDNRLRLVVEARCSSVEGTTSSARANRIVDIIEENVTRRFHPKFNDGSQPAATTLASRQ